MKPVRHLPAPYNSVRWTALHYPGLDCNGERLVLDELAELRVSGRRAPIAVALLHCNFNHPYANLFAFVPGRDPRRPALLQPLVLQDFSGRGLKGIEQPIGLSASPNQIALKVAGYTSDAGLCCPSVDAIRRWIWNGSRFRELRRISITRIVIPNVVGMSLRRASDVLVANGIVFFDQAGDQSVADDRLVVRRIRPPVGSVIHPPHFRVTVVARRR